ncbi:MAG: response regulator transcription factor [Clostridiales bacterium]|jgi:two-component system secretion system response regulator SalR|nr:response regulator transcription factor [Clostridiales bacterium]
MNILLVDDHVLFAKSLEIALTDFSEIESLVSTQNVNAVISLLKEKQFDVVMIDINLGNISDENGLTLASDILRELPATKILILTGYDLPVYRHEAEKMGVKGFANKSIDTLQLVKLLSKIDNGETIKVNAGYIEELTESEKAILQLLSDGIKRKDIAKQLYISERTLSNHVQHIFEKLDVSSALEAVTKGIKLGYIHPPY